MSKLTLLVAAIAVFHAVCTLAQPPSSFSPELAQLVAACNGSASSMERRATRACETLEKRGRLSLVEPAAVRAYQGYQQERRLEACRRRLASPRAASRGITTC